MALDLTLGIRTNFYHSLIEVYQPTISKNKEMLMDILKEKADAAAKSELGRKMKVLKGFYNAEIRPPRHDEITKLFSDLALVREFIKTGSFRFLTVKQIWLLFLVSLEIYLWFYLGETVGKFHIVGYDVKP
ncbi:ATP synthase subunit g, mitochondrial-like isoform X2 [Hyposmocoma kahamanoa]|uniref:ATP synthase subunit g, mitochondrial-like isoform X2 n=1 Tax=Hyposmocoma kahamanoa TaxID=1477025 RepID=UPI000E6D5F97|nr:ATP synthase subunit g, mitochondrial-like isoform X2 [Hyposmocoma kahamanoa]